MKSRHLFIIFAIILFSLFILFTSTLNYENMITNNKIVCLYNYYEKNEEYKKNFIYFLNKGLLNNVDYIIIINGDCTVDIPNKDNILVYKRENKGFDFGAYSYGIKRLDKEYEHYFFINTSVCGPYMDGDWTKPFINLFNENVKVVGTSINMSHRFHDESLRKIYNKPPPYNHVQSMFFCIDKTYFNYLNGINFFNEEELNNSDMIYTILNKEIGLSQHAIKNGWNINCILSKYRDLNYRTLDHDINPTSRNGDPYRPGAYFHDTITKEEAIFFKTNRF